MENVRSKSPPSHRSARAFPARRKSQPGGVSNVVLQCHHFKNKHLLFVSSKVRFARCSYLFFASCFPLYNAAAGSSYLRRGAELHANTGTSGGMNSSYTQEEQREENGSAKIIAAQPPVIAPPPEVESSTALLDDAATRTKEQAYLRRTTEARMIKATSTSTTAKENRKRHDRRRSFLQQTAKQKREKKETCSGNNAVYYGGDGRSTTTSGQLSASAVGGGSSTSNSGRGAAEFSMSGRGNNASPPANRGSSSSSSFGSGGTSVTGMMTSGANYIDGRASPDAQQGGRVGVQQQSTILPLQDEELSYRPPGCDQTKKNKRVPNQNNIKGVFLHLADWGFSVDHRHPGSAQCQMDIGRLALQYLQENDLLPYLKFVVSTGDNVYDGVRQSSGRTLQSVWKDRYPAELTCVPWYAVLGNHDYGHWNYATCYPYASSDNCGQVNGSEEYVLSEKSCTKSGTSNGAPVPDCWALPRPNYRVTAWEEELGIRILATDGSHRWRERYPFESGKFYDRERHLGKLLDEGIDLIRNEDVDAARNPNLQTLLVLNHWTYNNPDEGIAKEVYADPLRSLQDQNESLNIVYLHGHYHDTEDPRSITSFADGGPIKHYGAGGSGGYCNDECQNGKVGVIFGLVKTDNTIEFVRVPDVGTRVDSCNGKQG
ncbi:unnamed protein product [Amoebophrya sp. A120]|nr:unnamed protein product [Amoebophrya sp. A120]|eukprot:GSA120T00016487001.1